MHNTGKHLCQQCHHYFAEPDITWTTDPFLEDVWGEQEWKWLCGECYDMLLMEI